MARWYEGAEESAFKRVAEGYVFQAPTWSWPFGSPPAYLVNETQKEALAGCLRRQRGQTLLLALVFLLICVGGGLQVAMAHPQLNLSAEYVAALIAAVVVGSVVVALVPQLLAMRAIRPMLADLPRSGENITINERLQRVAEAISPKVLWIGGIAGSLMIMGSIIDWSVGRTPSLLAWQLLRLAFAVLLTSYFIYLAILKRRAKAGTN